jgi:hypothetical protein
MQGTRSLRIAGAALVAATLVAGSAASYAQSIEPRAYSNAPVGVNFLIAAYAQTKGDLDFGPMLPVTDARFDTSSGIAAYGRTLDLGGKSAKFDVILPYTVLSGSALHNGETITRDIHGKGDPLFRLSVNFIGAPALDLNDFRRYEQDLIVGASLQVAAPLGQYDSHRVVNLGANRWSFKPEVGVSKALGQWTLEQSLAATFFTDNTNFFGGKTLAQDPIYSTQSHVVYAFRSGVWASFDATYFTGGRTTTDGVRADNLQSNWRLGTTLALPIDPRNSLKFYASSGVSARTGNNFDLFGVAWQYRFGGGL